MQGCETCKQRGWRPLQHRGELFAEVAVEPRLVVRISTESGLGVPVANYSAARGGGAGASFGPARYIARTMGAELEGGPPSVRVVLAKGRAAFLGLAHLAVPLPGGSAGAHKRALRLSYHVFYVFEPKPPFELLGIGRPFRFPSELGMLQRASGMLLTDEGQLHISYGEHNCEARRVSVPVDAALADAVRLWG